MSGGIGSRALNKLTDVRIRAFINKRKSGERVPRKLADGGGMYVTLTPAGTPVWRVKYRLGPKEKLYAIGTYPAVSLDAARAERDAIKGQLREGHDPIQVRKLGRADATAAAGHTFKSVAQDWLAKQQREWRPVHYQKSRRAFERDVYPLLGKLPISGIRPVMVSGLIESIIKRGARVTMTTRSSLGRQLPLSCAPGARTPEARALFSPDATERDACPVRPSKKHIARH